MDPPAAPLHANARAVAGLHDAGESLVDVVWAHAPDPPASRFA